MFTNPRFLSQNGVLLAHFSVGDDIAMEVRLELSFKLLLTFMEDTDSMLGYCASSWSFSSLGNHVSTKA